MSEDLLELREQALAKLAADGATHVVYGYRAGDTRILFKDIMVTFSDDDMYAAYVDHLHGRYHNLSEVYAVHA